MIWQMNRRLFGALFAQTSLIAQILGNKRQRCRIYRGVVTPTIHIIAPVSRHSTVIRFAAKGANRTRKLLIHRISPKLATKRLIIFCTTPLFVRYTRILNFASNLRPVSLRKECFNTFD